MTWSNGLRGIRKKSFVLFSVLFISSIAFAGSYRLALNKWTREAKDYALENLEMRLDWKATYLSGEFRAARRERLQSFLQWTEEERRDEEKKDREVSSRHDEFFVGMYAGSNVYPDIGKNSGDWRLALDIGGRVIKAESIERVKVTEVERKLFPYLNQWSHAYLVRFPKSIPTDEKFSFKMMGIPATSELKW